MGHAIRTSHRKPRQNTFGLSPYHRRLLCEALEDRRLLSIAATITIGTIAPNPVVVGSTVSIPYTVTNTGSESHSFGVGAEIHQSSTTVASLPAQTTPTIGYSKSWSSTYSYTIPGNWGGPYTAWAVVWSGSPGSSDWLNNDNKAFTVTADTTKPTVDAFSMSPLSGSLGQTFTASWQVSDTGGSGLSTVELWRADDLGGSPVNWTKVNSTGASGNGMSGTLKDTPLALGKYWYGIHASDNAGNWGHESSSISVTVADTTKPTVDAFGASPPAGLLNQTFVASWTVSDSGGSGLSGVELWRTTDNNGVPLDSGWKMVNSTSASGNGPASGTLSDAPGAVGKYWYGIHAGDNAGNWGHESSSISVVIDTTKPTVDAFSMSPLSGPLGQTFTASWQVSDTGGSGLSSVELWRADDLGGSPVNWTKVNVRASVETGCRGRCRTRLSR